MKEGAMDQAKIEYAYDGPAVANGQIEVADLGASLIAMGQVFSEANTLFNGKSSNITVRVDTGFTRGSFVTHLEIECAVAVTASLISTVSAAQLAEYLGFLKSSVGSLLGLLDWLKGGDPQKVVNHDNSNVEVTNSSGNTMVFSNSVINLFNNGVIRKGVDEVVRPLEKPGYEKFYVAGDNEPVHTITKDTADYYRLPGRCDATESITTEYLEITRPSFDEGLTWWLKNANGRITATMKDQKFIEKMLKGEVGFSAGDFLKVRRQMRQWLEGDKIKTSNEILEVLEHKRAGKQQVMRFDSVEQEG
jgi:hypothetical protein